MRGGRGEEELDVVLGSLYPPPFMQKSVPEYELGMALCCVRAWVHACVMSFMASVQETQVASMRKQ